MQRTTNNGQTSTAPVVDNGQTDSDGTHVTITNDSHSHDQTNLDNGNVTYTADQSSDQQTSGTWPAAADEHVRDLIEDAQETRQKIENRRANHRNFNRLMTLLVAIVAGFLITWSLEHNYIPHGKALGPYSFVITVLLDASLTLYALIRHY